MSSSPKKSADYRQPWILQLCHGYDGPFLDCARQYAALFKDTGYRVCTVYLTGSADPQVEAYSESDEVIFLSQPKRGLSGLKLKIAQQISVLTQSRCFIACIAHRFKPTYLALIGSKLPVIGINHAFGVYSRFTRRLLANFYRERLTLLGVSDAVRDDIRRMLPNWPEARIQTLYNRIDIARIRAEQSPRETARHFLGLPTDAWIVGNVGRLHPDKDQETLLRGFAHARKSLPSGALLVIIGSGPLEDKLKSLAKHLEIGDAVRFLGQIPQARRYFKAFDSFALTSDHEPFGMVLLEAMAAGVATICTDCGGGKEVVRGTGLLVPLRAPEALAEAMLAQVGTDTKRVAQTRCEMLTVLEERFSDQAIRRVFWSRDIIPKIKEHVPNKQPLA